MSTSFLERFKGRTTILRKDAVQDILGMINQPSYPRSNNQGLEEYKHSGSKNKTNSKSNCNFYRQDNQKNATTKLILLPLAIKANRTDNQFPAQNPLNLQQPNSNPYKIPPNTTPNQQQPTSITPPQYPPQIQKQNGTLLQARHPQKSPSINKQWVKLGGLGANIGGEEWLIKKKKQTKMQEFSALVKSINSQKFKYPQENLHKLKCMKITNNKRQKGIQYSKNICKPTMRRAKWDDEQDSLNDSLLEELEKSTANSKIGFEHLKGMIHFNY